MTVEFSVEILDELEDWAETPRVGTDAWIAEATQQHCAYRFGNDIPCMSRVSAQILLKELRDSMQERIDALSSRLGATTLKMAMDNRDTDKRLSLSEQELKHRIQNALEMGKRMGREESAGADGESWPY